MERIQEQTHVFNKLIQRSAANLFRRSAMTTKINGIDRAFIRQRLLIEKPTLEISSEAVNKKGCLFTFAPLQIAQGLLADLNLDG